MKQWTHREFVKVVKHNGFSYNRHNGDHAIYVNKDGKQIAATPNDFYNYLYATDKDGYSQYAKEISSVKPEDAMQDEVLRAYLKFTGGSYKDLVNIAINKQEVKRLRVESAKGSRRNITITKPNSGKTDLNGIKLSQRAESVIVINLKT